MPLNRLGIDISNSEEDKESRLDQLYIAHCKLHQESYVQFLEQHIVKLMVSQSKEPPIKEYTAQDVLTTLLQELDKEKASLDWLDRDPCGP